MCVSCFSRFNEANPSLRGYDEVIEALAAHLAKTGPYDGLCPRLDVEWSWSGVVLVPFQY